MTDNGENLICILFKLKKMIMELTNCIADVVGEMRKGEAI